jgi:outer membrane protein assembly factor BamD
MRDALQPDGRLASATASAKKPFMHQFHSRPLAALVSLAAISSLGACAQLGLGGGAGGASRADTQYVASDVNTLYNAGKQKLDSRQYVVAAALFDEVERQHPYSVWARRAQLMSAFSYYLAKDHTKSVDSARRFLSIHPGNKDAPYALYLVALNYYEQIEDVNRDQSITKQALDSLGEVIRRYPGHALRGRLAPEGRSRPRSPRRQGDGDRPFLPAARAMAGGRDALPQRDRRISDDHAHARSPDAADRILSRPWRPEEARKSAAVLGATIPARSGTSAPTSWSIATRPPKRPPPRPRRPKGLSFFCGPRDR